MTVDILISIVVFFMWATIFWFILTLCIKHFGDAQGLRISLLYLAPGAEEIITLVMTLWIGPIYAWVHAVSEVTNEVPALKLAVTNRRWSAIPVLLLGRLLAGGIVHIGSAYAYLHFGAIALLPMFAVHASWNLLATAAGPYLHQMASGASTRELAPLFA